MSRDTYPEQPGLSKFILDSLGEESKRAKEAIMDSYRKIAQPYLKAGEHVVVMRAEGVDQIVYHGNDRAEAERALKDAQDQYKIDLAQAVEEGADPEDQEECPPELLLPNSK